MKRLILASGSPRRRELLTEAGFTFEVIPSPAEEVHSDEIPLAELCSINARAKAEEIAREYPDAVVLGADTLVYIDDTPLGKPKSEEQAVEMLKKLSGRKHQVCTGMCLIEGENEELFYKVTDVSFKTLTEEVISEYMSLVNVMDKFDLDVWPLFERLERELEQIESREERMAKYRRGPAPSVKKPPARKGRYASERHRDLIEGFKNS